MACMDLKVMGLVLVSREHSAHAPSRDRCLFVKVT